MRTEQLNEIRLIQFLHWHARHRKVFPADWWKVVGASSPEVASEWLSSIRERKLIDVDAATGLFWVTEDGLQLMTINDNGDEPIDLEVDDPNSTSTA